VEPSIHLIERRERRGRRIPALAAIVVIGVLGASAFGLFGFLEANAAFGTVLDLEEKYLCDAEDFSLDFPDLSRLSFVYSADGVLLGELVDRNRWPSPRSPTSCNGRSSLPRTGTSTSTPALTSPPSCAPASPTTGAAT
jgi:hypothetical protein